MGDDLMSANLNQRSMIASHLGIPIISGGAENIKIDFLEVGNGQHLFTASLADFDGKWDAQMASLMGVFNLAVKEVYDGAFMLLQQKVLPTLPIDTGAFRNAFLESLNLQYVASVLGAVSEEEVLSTISLDIGRLLGAVPYARFLIEEFVGDDQFETSDGIPLDLEYVQYLLFDLVPRSIFAFVDKHGFDQKMEFMGANLADERHANRRFPSGRLQI